MHLLTSLILPVCSLLEPSTFLDACVNQDSSQAPQTVTQSLKVQISMRYSPTPTLASRTCSLPSPLIPCSPRSLLSVPQLPIPYAQDPTIYPGWSWCLSFPASPSPSPRPSPTRKPEPVSVSVLWPFSPMSVMLEPC